MRAIPIGNVAFFGWDGGVLMDGREQKVGSAEKKLRLWLKMAHRVYQGEHVPTYGGLPKPTLRGSSLWLRLSPSCASAAPSLAWGCPQYAISDGNACFT